MENQPEILQSEKYYVPKMDVRMELLRPGMIIGGETFENIAWHYPFPNGRVDSNEG